LTKTRLTKLYAILRDLKKRLSVKSLYHSLYSLLISRRFILTL